MTFLIIAITILGLGFGLYACLQRPRKATHPTLVKSSLPPLIPLRSFYANARAKWGYKPSYDGSMIAAYGIRWTKKVIFLQKTGEKKPFLILRHGPFDNFSWHPYKNDLIVCVNGRIWQIDLLHSAKNQWVDITPRGFTNWRIERFPLAPEDPFLIASCDRNPAFFDLFTVAQNGGGKTLLERNEGTTIGWILDHKHMPFIKMDRLLNTNTAFFIRSSRDTPWRLLMEVEARDTFACIGKPKINAPIYALSNRGRDKLALVALDPNSGTEHVVAEHPKVDARVAVTLADDRSEPDFVLFDDDYPKIHSLTHQGRIFGELVQDPEHPVDFEILGSSPNGRFITVARSWCAQPYEFFLYDLEQKKTKRIGKSALAHKKNAFSEVRPVSFKARDGLEIHAFLTVPKSANAKNLPTVIMIHGGPALRDRWTHNVDQQFLAQRGYAVLSVNFRGSSGYGKTFQAAGYRQCGAAMQDDVVDSAHWLISEGISDPQNMAIMGGSYGGYSAALAMTRDAGLFKAAIIENAVLDVAYFMQNLPHHWELYVDEMHRYFGNPTQEIDLNTMRHHSPIHHIENAEGAILITAGKEDGIVGFEQSENFHRALQGAGKNVTAVYFEKEGHDYIQWQTRIKRARLIEQFLAKNLGGRSSRFDYVHAAVHYLS